MKKFTLLLLIAFLSCFTNAYAGLVTIESNFTNKDLAVGENELGWTASIEANSFESADPSRGVQFGAGKGVFTLKSNVKISRFKSITLVMSTNGSGNTMSISVASTNVLDVTTLTKANNQELTYNYTGAEPLSGIINICINNKAKSVYFKKISVTYEAEDTELTAPVISGVENGKEYINEATVNISKPNNATISYTVKKDGVEVDKATNATAAFSKIYNELGTYTVSASATDGTNTLKADDVTFTIKSNKVTSIAEFLAIAPNHQDIDFVFDCNLIVTYAKTDSKNLYVRDAAGTPLLIYMSQTAKDQFPYGVPGNGDYLEPGATGKYQLYLNTIQELIPTTLPDALAGNDNTRADAQPKVIKIGDAAANMSQYVQIQHVTFKSATEIECEGSTLTVYGTAPDDKTAQYTVTGVISYYNNDVQIVLIDAKEEEVLGTPSIEVTGETNATGFYLDKAKLKFVNPANATSMEYVVKKGETVLGQDDNLTEDATLDITICGEISIEMTAYMGDEDLKIANKTIKIIPSAPTVSPAAGTYYKAQTLTITAPEGATLDGLLNETDIENKSVFTAKLEVVNDDITTYELLVWSTKDDVSSDPVSATFVINPNVIDADVTGNIVIADQTQSALWGENVSEGTLTDEFGHVFNLTCTKTITGNATNMTIHTSSKTFRMYKNTTVTINAGDNTKMSKIEVTKSGNDNQTAAMKIDGWTVDGTTFTCNTKGGSQTITFTPTATNAWSNIKITYLHYDKVDDGAALIAMEKGKIYQVNVNLQGVEANGGVLYARTSELSAAPSEPRKDHDGFDSYEDGYKLGEFNQRDWVAIKGLGSAYEGFAVGTFIAAYDGEKLTPVASNPVPAPGSQVDIELNTFGVANVFYGNYKNTESLGMENDYRPFFVKAKVNEVANFVGKVTVTEGKIELWGSGVCGKLNEKGLEIDANGIEITASEGVYKQIEGVLVADAEANGGVKIVALSAPTTPTGVAALKADGKATVYGTEGAVVVNGADGKVMIFDAMGRMVKNVNVEGAATVAMPAGYYIVRTAGTAAKVMVK